jgi:hypothetical protein
LVITDWAIYQHVPSQWNTNLLTSFTLQANHFLADNDGKGSADVGVNVQIGIGRVTRDWTCDCPECCYFGKLFNDTWAMNMFYELADDNYFGGIARLMNLNGRVQGGISLKSSQTIILNSSTQAGLTTNSTLAGNILVHEIGHQCDNTNFSGWYLFDLHPTDIDYPWNRKDPTKTSPPWFRKAWNASKRTTWRKRVMHWQDTGGHSPYIITNCPVNGNEKEAYENWADN